MNEAMYTQGQVDFLLSLTFVGGVVIGFLIFLIPSKVKKS